MSKSNIVGQRINSIVFPAWRDALYVRHGTPLAMIGLALLLFPKLALGLSGFETGVAVMPLVKGDAGDDPRHPEGRIRNTKKLLRTAALIMSVLLIGSSIVTTLPPSWPASCLASKMASWSLPNCGMMAQPV